MYGDIYIRAPPIVNESKSSGQNHIWSCPWGLTVSDGLGRYILSSTAALIGTVAGFAWTILAYLAHNIRARKGDADLLHLQQQASFRNPQSSLSTAWELLCICWVWSPRSYLCGKRRDRTALHIKRRTSPIILYPLVV
jgi:hypothetical protein